MPLRPVVQENTNGCFIACVAMLLNKNYAQAFELLHPGKNILMAVHGFRSHSMKEKAQELLAGLGFKSRVSRYRKFRTFQSRVNKNAIMIVRWDYAPSLCHCIMYDADGKRFIDPSGGYPVESRYTIKRLQSQLDCAIIIDHIPKLETKTVDIPRTYDPYSGSW